MTWSAFIFCCGFASAAVAAKAEFVPVRWTLSVEAPAFWKKDERLVARLEAKIRKGYHISSLTQPAGGPERTVIVLADKQPFSLGEPIRFPPPDIVYSDVFGVNVESHADRATFEIPLLATVDGKAGTQITVEVTYQACSGGTCLLLRTDRVSSVVIARALAPGKNAADK